MLALLGALVASIDLPAQTKYVFMNIGSNKDPILPPAEDPSVAAIAFEPLVYEKIQPAERLFVVPAAVAQEGTVATMHVYPNNHGQSSSLFKPVDGTGLLNTTSIKRVFVPVVPMASVLNGVAPNIDIWFLMTDMQGFDSAALRAGGQLLRRVHYVTSETWLLGVAGYHGAQNDFCTDMLPLMLELGFEPLGLRANTGVEPHEVDILRANNTLPTRLGPHGNGGKVIFKERSGEEGTRQAHEYCEREAQLKLTGTAPEKPGSKELGSGRRPSDGTRPGFREAEAFFRRKGTQLPAPPLARHQVRGWLWEAAGARKVGEGARQHDALGARRGKGHADSPAVTVHHRGRGAHEVNCTQDVPSTVDEFPIRSPQQAHSLVATLMRNKEIVEIGTRNGDGMMCFAKHAARATAIEIDATYCAKLEARVSAAPRRHDGSKLFDVSCADYNKGVPDAHFYTWWMPFSMTMPILTYLRRQQLAGKIRESARALILFGRACDEYVAAQRLEGVETCARLRDIASFEHLVPYDEWEERCSKDNYRLPKPNQPGGRGNRDTDSDRGKCWFLTPRHIPYRDDKLKYGPWQPSGNYTVFEVPISNVIPSASP